MRCEVRLDRRAAPRLAAARHVRGAGRECQRLPRWASWWQATPHPVGGSSGRALMNSSHAEVNGATIRGACIANCRAGASHRAAPARAAGARAWHPGSPQAALQGGDRVQAHDADRAESAGAQLHARGAVPGVDGRHHVDPDRRRLAVPGHRAGPVQSRGGRLDDQAENDG